MSTAKIFIDPTSRILYASYYISGLYDVFNQKNVVFNNSYFIDLKRNIELFAFNHFFAFVHIENEIVTRWFRYVNGSIVPMARICQRFDSAELHSVPTK